MADNRNSFCKQQRLFLPEKGASRNWNIRSVGVLISNIVQHLHMMNQVDIKLGAGVSSHVSMLLFNSFMMLHLTRE